MSHPSRFDPAKRYTKVLWPEAEIHAHAHDFNDAQAILGHRLRQVADTLHRDGSILDGGAAVVDIDTGAVTLEAAKVYAGGFIHDVAERTDLVIPLDQVVRVGVVVVTETETYLTDPDLTGQVAGAVTFGQPGADREEKTAQWAQEGEIAGEFFAVYTVDHGEILTPEPPAQPFSDEQAQRWREALGHYVSSGWKVRALGYHAPTAAQHYTISEGVASIWGFRRERTQTQRIIEAEAPDLQHIAAEPHVVSGGEGEVVPVNHSPIAAVQGVTLLKEATATLTHGAYSGAIDPLPHQGVQSIVSVSQSATTYVAGTDYTLSADQVDWTPLGDEPAPGSSYDVTYTYLETVAPDSWDATSVTVSGAKAGSSALIEYDYKLPRIDLIAADTDGALHYIKGASALYSPTPPIAPLQWMPLAQVENDWGGVPAVVDVATRAVHFSQIDAIMEGVASLFQLVAIERLQRNMDARQQTSKHGVFVDPLQDDDQRDQGVPQTASIIDGELLLPILLFSESRKIGADPIALPHTESVAVDQPLVTGQIKIQPYATFEPLPARVDLDPGVHRINETEIQWTTPLTRRVTRTVRGRRNARAPQTVVTEQVLGAREDEASVIPELTVAFSIEGFGAGENLATVTFDGLDVAPRPDPDKSNSLTADAQGRLDGLFDIPAGVPTGSKRVAVTGAGGTVGSTSFLATGEVTIIQMREIHTTTITRVTDPVAQTFTLTNGEAVTGVDIKFAALGDVSNAVWVQLREVENGYPTRRSLAEARLDDLSAVVVGDWVGFRFPAPVPTRAGVEYCFVVMSDDLNHAVSLAANGGFDAAAQEHVSGQPYIVGVMFSSSNNITWTAHQNEDLTFRLHVASNTQTALTVPLGAAFTLTDCTDLIVLAEVETPTPETRALAKITRASGDEILAEIGQRVELGERVSEDVTIDILLEGSIGATPVLFPEVEILQGRRQDAGDYVTRAMTAATAQNPQVNVVTTFEALVPSGTSVTVELGYIAPNGAETWTASPQLSATPVGDGWVEFNHATENYADPDVRVRLTLNGSATEEVRVRDLRANVTPDPVNIITGV